MQNLNYSNISEKISEFINNLYEKITENLQIIIVYFFAIIALIAAYILEKKDLFYSQENMENNTNYIAAVYEKGIPTHDDTLSDLLTKIRISSRYDVSSVYWRRCIIVSVLLSFILIITTYRRLPTALELLCFFTVIYLCLYVFLNFYRDNLSLPATENVKHATSYLQSKIIQDDKGVESFLLPQLSLDDLVEIYKLDNLTNTNNFISNNNSVNNFKNFINNTKNSTNTNTTNTNNRNNLF